ncbi:MAG TPA: hypothetical protein VM055_05295 [Novosphingobium sp.]|nr:hypothetical protein [Novosphingobium sp.]
MAVLHRTLALPLALILVVAPAAARDSVGVFESWGAFRDAKVPRCYAIAMAQAAKPGDFQPYATVGQWPKRGLRNQVHFRLSRRTAPGSAITLTVGERRFALSGGGGNAWAANRTVDAGIVAAMRSATRMRVSAVAADGRAFADAYPLAGAASAIDAAALACAPSR